jgi:hypothetical protein
VGCDNRSVKAATLAGGDSPDTATSSAARLDEHESRPCMAWPKRVVFLFDQSKSTQTTRTEHPPLSDLDDVISCAKRHGGSIYVGVFRDTANQPFAHLLLEAEPAKPEDVNLTGNALLDVDREAAHSRVMEEYRKRHRAWLERTNAAIEAFRGSASPLLAQSSNARATDLATAVGRAYLALDEPTPLPWLARAPRVLIVVTDGADTVRRQRVPTAAFSLVLLTVNGNGLTGDLSHLHPIRFESFDSMLTYLTGGRHV